MNEHYLMKTIKIELPVEIKVWVHPGQKQINYPTDSAQEGIDPYIEDIELSYIASSWKEIELELQLNIEDYFDKDALLEELGEM